MGVYIYVIIVVALLVLPSLAFVLVNQRGGRRPPRRLAASPDAVPGVELPPEARPPFSLFFEGVELQLERDYELRGQHIVLHTALAPYTPSVWREFITTAAGVGFYGRGAQLDVQYTTEAGVRRSTMLPVVPLDPGASAS